MRLITFSILICLLLNSITSLNTCPSEKELLFEFQQSPRQLNLLLSSSVSNSKWNSNLTIEERDAYYEMIKLKQSFAASMSFLPRNFSPEMESYWSSLDYVVYIFLGIGAFPFAFVIFYFIVRFWCKKCRGPEKASKVTKSYRNITWILFMITSAVLICLLLSIVILSSRGK